MTEIKAKKRARRASPRGGRRAGPYPFEFRLRAVRLYLEEGYPAALIAQEMKIGTSTLKKWVSRYHQYGEDGLKDIYGSGKKRKKRTSPRVRQKIVDLKKKNPGHGSRRISDTLKRFFLIKTSPTTVRKTLIEANLAPAAPRKKSKKNPAKPRFFERARPNQMWQSDILTFRLGGKNAYLIAFIDDYSRFITAIGLYRSQTAENVLETYRQGLGEYGVPKEMLTDNGRQYSNWRGTTRFERELQKDRIKHIRSRPHHPMTLGKIERFWKSILNEFLQRAQFDNFEEARDRIRLWVKYYNHKRPHQGINGLCPADRFFEIAHDLKKTLERGIEENALELALRGKPRDPFYMVGRMGDQSVVIQAEKGKVKMLVDGEEASHQKELVYDLREDVDNEEKTSDIQNRGEDQSRTVGLDGASFGIGSMPGDVDQLDAAGSLAEPGHGGDAQEPECAPAGETDSHQQSPGETDYQADPYEWLCEAGEPSEDDPEESGIAITGGDGNGQEKHRDGPETGGDNHEGALRHDDGHGCRQGAGDLPQNLLQVGTAWPGGHAGQLAGESLRSTGGAGRETAGSRAPETDRGPGTEQPGAAAENGFKRPPA